jgi:predicted dehydrogenase
MTTDPSQALRTVVIGVGAGIFKTHRGVLADSDFEIVGVADINPDAALEMGTALDCPYFTDHRSLLAETNPQVAIIVTPHPFHAPIAIDCLQAGCHVLVEKPIAVQVAEADAMVEAAATANRLLTVSFQQRFRPEVRTAYKLIHEGALGQIQHVHMNVVWPRSLRYFEFAGWRGTWKGEGGGVLLNQAPHNLDMLCHLMGMPSQLVAWTRTRFHKIETEDTVEAMLEWPGGALGSLHISTAEAGAPERLEVSGTAGYLEIARGAVTYQKLDQDVRTFLVETEEMYRGPATQLVDVPLEPGHGHHASVYADFHQAITQDTPLMTDGSEARMSLELANGMILSSYSGRAIQFPLDRPAYAELLAGLQAQAK